MFPCNCNTLCSIVQFVICVSVCWCPQVNQTLLLLYLAVFSVNVPKHLRVFLVSIPGPNPAHWPAAPSLAQSLGQRGDLEALQLPRSWLDPLSLKRALEGNSPKQLSFSRCPALWPQVFQSLLEGGVKDTTQLISLNLSGINQVLYSECRSVDDQLDPWTMSRLAEGCSNIKHLNLMHTHYHHETSPGRVGETHLCASLAKFRNLRSLTLPACALSDGLNSHQISTNNTSPSALLLGLKKIPRVGVQNFKPDSESSVSGDSTSWLTQLLAGCPLLETLELIGPGFVSVLPRLEPCSRASVEPRGMCAWARGVGDAHIAAFEALPRLRRLTLAGLPGVLRGTGLVQMARQCRDLQVLSLANMGSLKTMNYTPALLDALRECTQLQELRWEDASVYTSFSVIVKTNTVSAVFCLCFIKTCHNLDLAGCIFFWQLWEHLLVWFNVFAQLVSISWTLRVFFSPRLEQPYLNANKLFFEALSCCSRLQRLCLISRSGTFDPTATEAFMERCCHVVMCHMFMSGTLVACRKLEKTLIDRSVMDCARACCTSNVECRQKYLTHFLHAFLLFSLLDLNVTAQPWMWSSTRYSMKTCQRSSDRSR